MGTYATADALAQVYRRLRDLGDTADEQLLSDTEIKDLIRQATTRYSVDRPAELVADIDPTGTRYLTLPATFEDGFSVIHAIEYPIDDDPPSYLDPRDVEFYRTPAVVAPPTPAALKLRLSYAIDTGTATVRISYTGRRSFGTLAADTTVLYRDYDAVCDLAVSNCCEAIAQKYARLHEPILGASGMAPRDKAEVWASRARRYEARYRQAVGPALGSAIINWDSRSSWRFGAWLNHPSIRR